MRLAGWIAVREHDRGSVRRGRSRALDLLHGQRLPDLVVGLVLVDAASEHELEGEWLAKDVEWIDGSTMIDRPTSGVELAAVDDLGGMPLVVLSQGQTSGQFAVEWSRFQAELAT